MSNKHMAILIKNKIISLAGDIGNEAELKDLIILDEAYDLICQVLDKYNQYCLEMGFMEIGYFDE